MPSVRWRSSGLLPNALSAKTDNDTICAAATAPGRGGVGIVRLSGSLVPEIIHCWLKLELLPRHARMARFENAHGELLDHGLALYFPAPHSYTGEHVLELHGHGNPLILESIVERLIELGARRARPGEFTQRAFLNDKMDLAQAEAVADVIEAASLHAARAAQRSLEGVFSSAVDRLMQGLVELRIYVEAALDFPDEEIDFLADGQVEQRLQRLRNELAELLRKAEQGRILNDGLKIAIIGCPNAGKSSLLNALAQSDRAIVTDIPGTTRDVVKERISIGGLPVELIDTAGLRETADIVEAEGVRRTHREIQRADVVLWILDETDPSSIQGQIPQTDVPLIKVHNKIDLKQQSPRHENHAQVWISALTGAGLEILRHSILHHVGLEEQSSGEFSARARHVDIIIRAREHLDIAHQELVHSAAGELVAEELKQSSDLLGEITGKVSSDDLLGKIFGSFCIGK